MSTEDLKALERRWYAEWNKGKAAAMAATNELIDTNCVMHSILGQELRGINDFKKHVSESFDIFPDEHIVIDDMVAEGDKVALRKTATGTHKGAYMGVPPTNKKVTMSVIEIDRFAGGKFVEGWETYDMLGAMRQLGLAPTPQK
jgi:steroid delta-isomerase-like uncharacterized protein